MGDNFKQSQQLAQESLRAAPIDNGAMPRIAINGRFLTQRASGVQRFAAEAIKAIDAQLDGEAYRGLKGRIEIVAPAKARDLPLKNIPIRRAGFFSGYIWEQFEYPLHAAGQLLLNLCMLGPLIARHQIVVVHDATVRALPANFSSRFRAAYGFLIPRLCRRADLVVTVSEFSRQEIGRWYGANIDTMPICFEGGDHITSVAADLSILDRLDLHGRKFFLGVGIDSSNKNIASVIAAFRQAAFDDTVLVLTGAKDRRVFGQFSEIHADGVRMVGFISDQELRALYEHALALVFPSFYEGFGLPPVEAMTCGCPVVISEQPALVEVCGDAALRCDANDVTALARHMRALNDDAALRSRLAAAGRARARRFTWAATAQKLLDLCLQVASRRTA